MKKIFYITLLASILISCEKPISDFQSENFIKIYGSGYESKGNDVIELSNGGYLITGYDKVSTDNNLTVTKAFVAKLDKNGNTIWSKTYGQDKYRSEGIVLKEVADGYLIAGIYNDAGISNSIQHSFILKIDFEGNEVFNETIGDSDYDITINDIVVDDNNIYVVGFSDVLNGGLTDYYIAQLNYLGETQNVKNYSIGKNCSFQKVFSQGESLMIVATDKNAGRMYVSPFLKSTINYYGTTESPGENNEQAVDAAFIGENLFLLSTGGASNFKLSKLNPDLKTSIWDFKPANSSIFAKALAYQNDGSLMVCGESSADGNPLIHFIKLNPDGSVFNSENYFKTISGNIGKIKETRDNGLIMVGSTAATYGMNIQLIKTDKDYFMLIK